MTDDRELPTVRLVHDEPPARPPQGLAPARAAIEGRWATLEPLNPARHGADLFACSHADETARALWRYLPYGPFADIGAFNAWLEGCGASSDPLFFALCQQGRARGMASLLNIRPRDGVLEMGHIWFSPALQKSRAATEAMALMLAYAFDRLGYRRVEWKCNALNGASRRAARRLGFRFEGIFYRHMVVKGRNRDTAWYAMVEDDWPQVRVALAAWLDPANFDRDGRQINRLRAGMRWT
jgi:RimJ/RimL family protein N-acetyltransferase